MTQQELADALNVSDSLVSQWESSKKLPSIQTLWSIADYFKVSIDYLIDEENIFWYLRKFSTDMFFCVIIPHNTNVVKADFKKRLVELRKEKGYSQEELSRLVGYSRSSISDWEIGRSEPDLKTLIKLADIFDISTDYLLGRVD